jgi:hypothetical protein
MRVVDLRGEDLNEDWVRIHFMTRFGTFIFDISRTCTCAVILDIHQVLFSAIITGCRYSLSVFMKAILACNSK